MRRAEVTVRRLQKDDFHAVRKIYRAVIEDYQEFLKETGETDDVSPMFEKERFNFYLEKTKSSFVAELKGKVVGFILSQELLWGWQQRKRIILHYYAVSPEYQRLGIGLRLLEEVKKYAIQHNLDELATTLNINNEASKRVLQKAGYLVKDWRVASLDLGGSPSTDF